MSVGSRSPFAREAKRNWLTGPHRGRSPRMRDVGVERRVRHRCHLLIPDLNFIAIGIGDVDIRIPRRKLATSQNCAAGTLNFGNRHLDVGWPLQPKAKMSDATRYASAAGTVFECNDIMRTGAQHLNGRGVAEVLSYAEDLRVEP